MEWFELYEKIGVSDKEEFKRLANLLLSKTFIVRDYFDQKEMIMKVSHEYRFFERHFELFAGYLSYSGWEVRKDNQYGVISIENIYDYNRIKLDKFSTLMLYTLRLIFEEERERVTLRNEIATTTVRVIHKMLALNIVKRRPPYKDIVDSLRLLSNHNIVQKISGDWIEEEAKILILPSILFVVSNERISKMHEIIESEEVEDHETA